MVGHRRTRKPGTSTTRPRHHDNAKAQLLERLDAATDATGRLQAAMDYLRGAHVRATRRGEPGADDVLDSASHALVRAGDRLIQ
ncbi:hypothetical protein BS329_15560 [Amycolatopsis coloradensis]|uniref:CHAD domain-containing protein n=1 Tax=Amycolatopsis coloradensis TaxID=76021 RepID=A0A1R0KUA6_9PSEU|nr:hypothetical protein [Amycolatopsis coloradensis]OLZ51680.1 hypothetical protein BS329_15560 [Amycolatopsis coloradensis]